MKIHRAIFSATATSLLFTAFVAPTLAQDSARLVERYKQMLEKNPGEGTALERLWKIYQDNSQTAQLLDEYKAAEGRNDFAAALIYGHLLRKAGQIETAAASFHHATSINPQSTLPHLALAGMFLEKPDFKNAAAEFEAAAVLMQPTDPALPDLLLKLGGAWLSAGEQAKAAEAWERTVALDPKNLELRQRLAENYIANNLPDKALPHYETIGADGDVQQQTQALQGIARIHQMKGDTELAAQALEKAIALVAPGNWLRGELQGRLIRLYQRSHRTAELEQRWKKNAAENPRDPGAYLQLVELYERLGDPEQQRDWLEKLCALAPANFDYKLRLARICSQLGQNGRATDLFDEILKVQPGNTDVLFVRAEIDLQNNAPQSARERIEKFLKEHSGDESLPAKAVEFYMRHHLPDAAEEHLKMAAAQDQNALLALAIFYFSERKSGDAKLVLQRLVKDSDSAEKKATVHSKIAGILKEQKDIPGAEAEFAMAVELQPASPVYRLALCDFFTGLGRFDEAQSQAEKALELSKDEASQSDADAKLFQVFQMRETRSDEAQKSRMTRGGVDMEAIFSSTSTTANGPQESALEKYVKDMAATAEQNPTPGAMLRVARWQMWRQRTKEALDFAQRAIDLQPDLIVARELSVKIASPEQKPQAVEQLRELIKLDPARESFYSRQIGHLLQESGQTEEAVQLFSEMEKTKPGDIDTLSDLAGALQQSERWDDATAVWQRAFDLAPAPRRKEIAATLVRALEHGNAHEKAAAVLLKITDGQADDAQRPGAFQDLLAYCTKHGLTAWLQAQYEQKLRANADDYFSQVALSKILKADGHEEDALSLLGDATFSAEDQAPTLRELANEADEMGDFDAAVSYQKRAVLISPQEDSSDMERLAALQESKPDADAAGRTWEKITAKFPRDPSVLTQAADFFQRWNLTDRAREFLRKAADVEPANLQTLMTLGQLAADAGDRAEAVASFEKVLKNSAPENDGGQIKFPGVKAVGGGRFQQSYFSTLRLRNAQPDADTMRSLQSFWAGDDGRSVATADLRLRAIRRISEILKSGGDKNSLQAWLARWQNAEPVSAGEPLWAFYFSGANGLVMKRLDELMRQSPKSRLLQQGFVWLSLQMREYDALRRWTADAGRSAEERDLLLISLGQLLGDGRAGVDPKLVDGLFPPQFPSRQILWQAAVLLASKGCFDDAVKLGERVLATVTAQQASYALELAHWHVYRGDIDAARRVLRIAISGTGDTLDAPIYSALREYFLLLPENERAGFVATYAAETEKKSLHSALSLALLYGLQNDEEKARDQLAKLVALRPVSTRQETGSPTLYRVWNFILTTGLQLQTWRLNPLAVDLWELALADSALIRLQGDAAADNVRDIRLQLTVAKLASATPEECDRLIDDSMRSMSPENFFTLGNVLENTGAAAQAGKIFLRLWKDQPGNRNILQRLLNTCRIAQDRDTEVAVLRESLAAAATQKTPDSDAIYQQTALQLASALDNSGRVREAQRVIEHALEFFPIDTELLDTAANLYQRGNQGKLAVKSWRKLLSAKPDNENARRSLFQLLSEQEKYDEAVALIGESSATANRQPDELARLCFKIGQPEKAVELANKTLQSRAFDRIPAIASLFNENGRGPQAVKFLQTAIARCKDANTLYRLESSLADLLPDDAPQALQDQCFARLANRIGTEERRGGENSRYNLLEQLSKKFHREELFAKELETDWRDGAGSSGAGLRLLRLHEKDAQKLRAICEALFQRSDFNAQTMGNMQGVLENAEQYDLLEKGWRILCGKNPMDHQLFANLARALFLSGRKQDAVDVLEKLGARHVFAEEVAGLIAEEYVRAKDDTAAEKWYEIAVRQGPLRNPNIFADYALLLLDRKEFAAAKRTLLALFRGSASSEPDLLARYFIESGRDEHIEGELGEFALTPSAVADFRVALIRHYCEGGQPSKGIAVAAAHPEIIASRSDVLSNLRDAARESGEFEKVNAIFEKIAATPDGTDVVFTENLARFYFVWVQNDKSDAALARLARAAELAPEIWDIAELLAIRLAEKNQNAKAVEILNRFIAATRDSDSKGFAKEMISKLGRAPAAAAH